ncbi:LacI family DNA-binding transcriptional regulator [Bifidobacterium oedipodis]|uniref:Purine operon repressor n=1 Tax=Bifidobacterium oedipodis TaxID=2675322 RepID=A0A7Y0ERR7_9BIFI|nr:LacI family DNA-binding transcriptional regulator [Bifidobacterium sp. DSM 109957]NMM94121.1 purine operon repressor [Bifidobacterium sp. DSM 109957]
MVTLDDVAALAGVSRMTASNALNNKPIVKPATAQRVLDAAAQLGYRPNLAARQLSSGRTHIIGLTIADFDLIFPADLAACVSDQAQARGYQVIVQQTRFSSDFERAMAESPVTQICDGTIVCWPSSASAELMAFGRAHPLVVLDGFGLEGRCDCAFTPCADGMAAAAKHLADQGCRRVLILGGDYEPLETDAGAQTSSCRQRVRGAAQGLRDAGLPYERHYVVPCAWTREAGYAAMTRLLAQGRDFDGVCCLNDPVAIGAYKALQDAGVRIPDDVAITGFDGVADGRYLSPGLTSVVIDPNEVARVCLNLLIQRIERGDSAASLNDTDTQCIDIGFQLIQRGSAERQ